MVWILLFALGAVTSAISGTLGMAGGMILLSGLSFFVSMREAIPIHGFTTFCSNLGRIIAHFRHIAWPLTWRFLLAIVPGAYLGGRAVKFISSDVLELVVAGMILAVLYAPPIRLPYKNNLWWYAVLGFGSSFVGMIAGATGPLIAPFFMNRGLTKEQMVATKAACQGAVQLVKLPAFVLVVGFPWQDYQQYFYILALSAFVGTWIGARIIDKLTEKHYELAVRGTLTVMAGVMVFRALRNLF